MTQHPPNTVLVIRNCKPDRSSSAERKSASSGASSKSASSGDYSKSASSGHGSNSTAKGNDTIAMAAGTGCAVSAGENGCFATAWYDESSKRYRIVAAHVGENGIKPDTLYCLNNKGEWVEVQN